MVHMAPHGLAPRLFARFSAVVRSELQNFGAIPVLARSFSARAFGLLAMANVTKRNFWQVDGKFESKLIWPQSETYIRQ